MICNRIVEECVVQLIVWYCSHFAAFDVFGTGTKTLAKRSPGSSPVSFILLIVFVIIFRRCQDH